MSPFQKCSTRLFYAKHRKLYDISIGTGAEHHTHVIIIITKTPLTILIQLIPLFSCRNIIGFSSIIWETFQFVAFLFVILGPQRPTR